MKRRSRCPLQGIRPADLDEQPEDEMELNRTDSTKYRALVARGMYLAQDRTDIQYAVKELSRAMAKPTVLDLRKLKRLGR